MSLEIEYNHITNMCLWVEVVAVYALITLAKSDYRLQKENRESKPLFRKSLKNILFSDIK